MRIHTMYFRVTFAFLTMCFGFGCNESDSDDDVKNKPLDSERDTGTANTGGEATDDTETASDTAVVDPCEAPKEHAAISATFEQGGGETFYMSTPDPSEKPEDIYDDNGTAVSVEDRDCIMLHANADDNDGYGYSIEFQLGLDKRTDLQCENYTVSFDVYVPQAVFDESDATPSVQWAFFETDGYTPIYSFMLPKEGDPPLAPDTWTTFTSIVNRDEVSYEDFPNDPQDWQVDVVRIQLVIDGDLAKEGNELTFYVDDLVVKNF